VYFIPGQGFRIRQRAEQFKKASGGVTAGYCRTEGVSFLYCFLGVRDENFDAFVGKSFRVGNNFDIRFVACKDFHAFTAFAAPLQSNNIIHL
jgi:hypothetical protein